ncbi:MAG TPA: hypothetical protein VHC86_07890 [Opitutaceae bacterium]|nr:hypothetical protein [Opitutaceae bacterium]
MHKKHYIALLGALAVGTFQVRAQTATTAPEAAAPVAAPAAPDWSWTLTPSYASVYMFRGQRLGGQSFQPSISGVYGPWNVGVWASAPVNHANLVHGQSNPEVDPNATYTYTVNGNLSVVGGATLYTYLDAPTKEGFYKATFEPSIGVNYTIAGLTINPKYYYDLVLATATYEANFGYSIPLKELGSSLNLSVSVGTYYGTNVINGSNPKTHAWGDYYSYGISTPYTITKNSTLTVGVAFVEGSGAYFKQAGSPRVSNTSAVRRTPITVSYAWTF